MAEKSISETVDKALLLLGVLAEAGIEGASLGAVAEAGGLSKPTAHRLLGTLVRQAFAERVPQSRLYRLGPAVGTLARRSSAADFHAQRWRARLQEIAEKTEAAAFLLIRSGDDALCVDVYFGQFMVPTLTAGIGGRIPLGLGPGTQAILAALPDDEVRAILARNAPRLRLTADRTLDMLFERVLDTRARGLAFDPGELLPEIRGLAVTLEQYGIPLAMTVSIASLASRLPESSVEAVAELLREAARQVVSGERPAPTA